MPDKETSEHEMVDVLFSILMLISFMRGKVDDQGKDQGDYLCTRTLRGTFCDFWGYIPEEFLQLDIFWYRCYWKYLLMLPNRNLWTKNPSA